LVYEKPKHKTEIVIVHPIEENIHPLFRLKGRIMSGTYTGRDCLLSTRKDISSDVVARIDKGPLNGKEEGIFSYFIRENPPKGFDFFPSDKLMLLGALPNETAVPRLCRVLDFYYPGFVLAGLHFHNNRPFQLFLSQDPEESINMYGRTRPPIQAIAHYSLRLQREDRLYLPRMISHSFTDQRRLTNALMQLGMQYIQMDINR
jgi:hypothetical protein